MNRSVCAFIGIFHIILQNILYLIVRCYSSIVIVSLSLFVSFLPDILKMVTVDDRNVNNYFNLNIENNLFINKAIVLFLSRIIFSRLDCISKNIFRKVEKSSKLYMKVDADIRFLNTHSNVFSIV